MIINEDSQVCFVEYLVSPVTLNTIREHSLFMAGRGGGLARIRGVIIFFSSGMGVIKNNC